MLGCQRVVCYDVRKQHSDAGFVISRLDALRNLVRRSSFRLVYQPGGFDFAEMEEVSKVVYETGNLMYVVEEADLYAPKFQSSEFINSWLRKCVNWGRMQGVGVVAISQRPANLHNDILGNAKHYFIFHLHLPGDLDWLMKCGVHPDVVKMLPKLRHYPEGNTDWVHYDGLNANIYPPVPWP